MSFSTWHNYGYGICTSDLKVDSVERIEALLEHAPEYKKEIHDWFDDCDITEPTVDDYLDFDQDYNNGIAAILQAVIKEATGIEFSACDNFDCMRYLIYKEGDKLRHAVHYYAIHQYIGGEDYLFAMRDANDPETPFITLEFDLDGKLRQARKLNNAIAKEEDELAFINRFRKEVLMPYIIEQKKDTTYLHLLETFCKDFGSYVTGNWKENHLNIYIHLRETPLRIACYGLGKVNWSGESDPEYPFHKSLQALLPKIPKGVQDIHVEFNCGRMYNVNLTVE